MSLRPKSTLILIVIACFAFAIWAFAFKAQKSDTKNSSITVTGCLQKGHDASEYQLNAENAKWHLKSDNVTFADHVGHKVKVAGVVSNQPFHGMKEDLKGEVEKKPIETGVLIVTNLEMVSDSCN